MRHFRQFTALLFFLSSKLEVIHAYGVLAHKLIARLAWRQMNKPVKERVNRMLPEGTSFVHLSCWADTVKHQPAYIWTRRLHHIDLQDDPPNYCSSFIPAASLSSPNVISATRFFIKRFMRTRNVKDFAFLVHFFTDAHMPLHRAGSLIVLSIFIGCSGWKSTRRTEDSSHRRQA